jgi:hypothetical protein
VADASARHPYNETPGMHVGAAGTVTQLRCLVDELVESGIYVVRELDLSHRLHPFQRTPDSEPDNALFRERRIKDALRAKLGGKIHGAAKDTAEGYVFTEEKYALVGGHSGR